jgi:hypothetical protein
MSDQPNRLRFRLITRGSLIRLAVALGLVIIVLAISSYVMFSMPGKSYDGPIPTLSDEQQSMRDRLRADVEHLAGTIGERNVFRPAKLREAADWLETQLREMGYQPQRQTYETTIAGFNVANVPASNIEVELTGSDRVDEIIIIGAHYDSVMGSPGANDNGSGVVALLELARQFADAKPQRTLRFVFFVNEEPPMFQTEQMGSLLYANRSRERGENIVGMISLETIGYYADEESSQHYPPPLGMVYPTTGNFVGFVSNVRSRRFLREVVAAFRDDAKIPSEGGAIYGGIPGVGWSDTALFRYPHYHLPTDTPDKLDYDRLALVVEGMIVVTAHLAGIEAQ